MPGSHGASADEDRLDDGEHADACPHGGDEKSVVDVIADVCGDGGAEEGWDGAECGDCAYPEARPCEVVSDPGLCCDAGEYADVDDGFGSDDPGEATIEELVEYVCAALVDVAEN